MSKHPKIIFVVVLLGLFSCQKSDKYQLIHSSTNYLGSSDAGQSSANKNQNINEVFEQLLDELNSLGFTEVQELTKRIYNDDAFDPEAIESIVQQKRISSSDSKYQNRLFHMVLYKYKNKNTVTEVLKRMMELPNRDIVFKDNNAIIPYDRYIILVKAGCNLPGDKWQLLLGKIKANSKEATSSIYCDCGSECY